jgi:uncharacterized protein YbjT (DUF2867 family)
MTILITGATGNAGRHLVRDPLRDPTRVGLPPEADVARDPGNPATLTGVFDGVDGPTVTPVAGRAFLTSSAVELLGSSAAKGAQQ